jgi:hypothetical protein
MARVVTPITGQGIIDFITANGDNVEDITAINEFLRPLVFDTPERQTGINSIIALIVRNYVDAYIPLIDTLLFHNRSSAGFIFKKFASQVVADESAFILDYLELTRTDDTIIQEDRTRIIKSLIVLYTSRDKGVLLIALLEYSRLHALSLVQYAVKRAYDSNIPNIWQALIEKYRNDLETIPFLVNGVLESTNGEKFANFNVMLETIIEDAADRVKLDGSVLAAENIPACGQKAAYSLTSPNIIAAVGQIALIPNLQRLLQPLFTELSGIAPTTNLTGSIILDAPTTYLDALAPNILVSLCINVANENLLITNIRLLSAKNVSRYQSQPGELKAMQILIQKQLFKATEALWLFADSTADEPTVGPINRESEVEKIAREAIRRPMRRFYREGLWFPSDRYIVPDTKFYKDITDVDFQRTFFAEYKRVNPTTRAGVPLTTEATAPVRRGVGRFFAPQAVTAATDPDEQAKIIAEAFATLSKLADYTPKNEVETYSLLSLRDELQRVTSAEAWNSQPIVPLIAQKAAVIKEATYGEYSLLKVALDGHADPNQVDGDGFTALQRIVAYTVENVTVGRLTTPRPLILLKDIMRSATVNLNITSPAVPGNNTPLHTILNKDAPSYEVLDIFLQNSNVNTNLLNDVGDTPLFSLFRPTTALTVGGSGLNTIIKLIKKSDLSILNRADKSVLTVAIESTGRIDDANLASLIKYLLVDESFRAAAITLAASLGPLRKTTLIELKQSPSAPTDPSRKIDLPEWVPSHIKTILSTSDIPESVVDAMTDHIMAVDRFTKKDVATIPSLSDDLMNLLKGRFEDTNYLNMFGVVSRLVSPDEITVTFNDDTKYALRSPYKATYRETTVYNPNGRPVLPAGASVPDTESAQRNNDILVKLVGKEYITPTNQPFLRKILQELYYAKFNPPLGNDLLTATIHLLMKFASLEKYHTIKQLKTKDAVMSTSGLSMLKVYLTNLKKGTGLRFSTPPPMHVAFPALAFTGRSTHGPLFVAASAAVGGIIPVVPGLRAGRRAPPGRGGLRALAPIGGGGGIGIGGGPPPLTNIFTGDPIDPLILASNYPIDITLGVNDALTYAPIIPGFLPELLTVVSAQEVKYSDPFYKFAALFGFTALSGGKTYILRPAEMFIALFHQSPAQIREIALDARRDNQFMKLLREICIPSLKGLATFKELPNVVKSLDDALRILG